MDALEYKQAVDAARWEIKQRRERLRPPERLTPQEERDRQTIRMVRRNLRNRNPAKVHAERERLRGLREDGFHRDMGDEARDLIIRNANVRFRTRTGYSGPNGVELSLSPEMRINRVGVASRRRRVSPGLVPSGPPPSRRRR